MSTNQPKYNYRRHQRLSQRQRQRLSIKQMFIGGSSILAAAITGLLIYFQVGSSENAHAAFSGDYRTVSSGYWHTPRIWEVYNGSEWISTNTPPSVTANTIEISAGHTVIVSTKIKADQLVVDEMAKLITDKGNLIIENGQGTDLTVKGEMEINGNFELSKDATAEINQCVLNLSGKMDLAGKIFLNGRLTNNGGKLTVEADHMNVNDKGSYNHAFNGGSLPFATWSKNSLCEITGVQNQIPENLSQAFGNFKWNTSSQINDLDLKACFKQIQKDLIITSTGNNCLFLDKENGENELTLGGNFLIQGGTVFISQAGSKNIKVNGNVEISGGELNFNTQRSEVNSQMTVKGELSLTNGILNLNSASNASNGVLNLLGNMSVNGAGLITESSINRGGEIIFKGNKIQFAVCNNNIKNKIDFTVVTGSTLRLDNYHLTGSGDFNLLDGAGMMIGSPEGISNSEMRGNIQVSGRRNYSEQGFYSYNGGSEQETGDGLPSIVRALNINNEANCNLTKSVIVSGSLALQTGKLITGKAALTLGINETTTGTLNKTNGYVQGNLRRWISSSTTGKVEFPVGTTSAENTAVLNFTKAPTKGGTITCSLGIGNVDKLGLPLTDNGEVCMNAGYAYWNLSSDNGYTGGKYDLSLAATGFPGIQDYEKLHISRRNSLYNPWVLSGKHGGSKGTNEKAIVERKDLSDFGVFGITSTTANSLPTEMVYFKAISKNQSVSLSWEMACEMNTDYFSVERSENGSDFTSITNVKSTGKSTEAKSYAHNDFQPLNGTSYYRLRQVSYDGKSTFSNIERVNIRSREAMASSVNIQRVGPEPFNSIFTTEYYAEANGDVAVEILNSNGQSVYKNYQYAVKGYNTFTFDKGSSLPEGRYTVRVSNSNGAARKFITKRN